jgi:hypothetical protein
LKGISQYNHICFFDKINNNNELYKEKIIEFYNNLKSEVDLKQFNKGNFILDIVIIEESIKIIELNPFESATGIF